MASPSTVTGDQLLALLGLEVDAALVQDSLTQLARGMQPELDPDDENDLVDWVTVNEIGLEYGFEDEAYVRALDPMLRRKVPLILSQLYFYGNTPNTKPFPYPLPFGLTFDDDRAAVRRKLAAYEDTRRSYIRDAWRLPKFDLTIAYRHQEGALASVLCHLPYAPWPPTPEETKLAAAFPPQVFAGLFGLRWSSPELRQRLAPLGYNETLGEVRARHMSDLLLPHGLELSFAPSSEINAADRRYSRALALAGVTFYASRELDAREWSGDLPRGLKFSDTQEELFAKVAEDPADKWDDALSGGAVWHFTRFTLKVLYSTLENRLLRVTILAPGYWDAVQREAE